MEIPKFIKGVAKYFTYASDSGETTPTTQADLQELMKNNNTILECLVDGLWQPKKEMKLNQIIRSPNMPANMIAQVTSVGTTGTTEPEWPSTVGSTITDGTAKWTVRANISSVNGVVASKDGEVQVKSLLSTRITTVVDLNDFKKEGVYYCPENELAVQCLNMPINLYAFYLEIITMGSNFVKQVFTTYKPSAVRVYVRNYYANDNGWGEWKEFAYKNDISVIPVGIIMPFAGNGSIPDGWVICNGAAVSRSTYAALFSAIGTTYGTGNDSTTFNLPNLMNRFIEGSNTAGTVLAAGLPNITGHFSTALEWSQVRFDGAFRRDNQNGSGPEGSEWSNSQLISFDASRSSAIYGASTTVQPPAMTAIYCIKY